MRYRTWLLALTLSLSAPQSALAQPEDTHAAAEDLFRQGREALSRKDYKGALELFNKAQGIEPGRGKLINIALCEEELGQLTEAAQHFQEVLPQLTPDDERLEIARQHLAGLGPRIPRLRIDLANGARGGAGVTLDGAPLSEAALGTEMPADPGKHVITVTAPGRREMRYDLTLEEGKRAALVVEPGAVVAAKNGAPREAHPASSRRTAGFVVGGVGLAGLAAGGVTGILALVSHSAAESECPLHKGCSADIVNQASTGKSLSVVSTIAFAAGAVGVGVGLYLVLSSDRSSAAPRAGLTLLPDGGRLGFSAAF